MGQYGPLPKTENVIQLHGNAGKRPVQQHPSADPGAPTMPRELSTEAKAEWKRVVPELVKMGLLGRVDRAVLVAYCETWSSWWAKKGHYQAPTKTLIALAMQLGLTPAARLRLPVPANPAAHPDDF